MSIRDKILHSNYFVIIVTAVIAFLILQFIAQPALVYGDSMIPTLHNGELVLLLKTQNEYKRFDVIVTKVPNNSYYVKRVIGCPGDTIQIINGYVYINENKLDDKINIKMDYAGIAKDKIELKENEYFVLGDNRNNSKDSRYDSVGIIKEQKIKGKVCIPFNL